MKVTHLPGIYLMDIKIYFEFIFLVNHKEVVMCIVTEEVLF
jgi:hypothetical protein